MGISYPAMGKEVHMVLWTDHHPLRTRLFITPSGHLRHRVLVTWDGWDATSVSMAEWLGPLKSQDVNLIYIYIYVFIYIYIYIHIYIHIYI